MKDERVVHVFDSGVWIEVKFDKLKEGDRFRLFQDGEQVINTKGQKEFIASCSPFINQYGDLVVNIY